MTDRLLLRDAMEIHQLNITHHFRLTPLATLNRLRYLR